MRQPGVPSSRRSAGPRRSNSPVPGAPRRLRHPGLALDVPPPLQSPCRQPDGLGGRAADAVPGRPRRTVAPGRRPGHPVRRSRHGTNRLRALLNLFRYDQRRLLGMLAVLRLDPLVIVACVSILIGLSIGAAYAVARWADLPGTRRWRRGSPPAPD